MSSIRVKDVHPLFGAEIEGFDASMLGDEEICRQLSEVFDRRGLLLFHDLDIDHTSQLRFCEMMCGRRALGDNTSPPAMPLKDTFYISNKRPASAAPYGRLRWHADTMWSDSPFEVLSLYAKDVEQPAVPTIFVSAVHAWQTLPEHLRTRVEGVSALHTAGEVQRGMEKGDVLSSVVKRPPTTTQPIGLRHPRTGKTILYICEQMTERIVGLDPDESESLLQELFEHLYNHDCCWEQNWRQHDLVVWDNLALQHARADVTTDGPARTLRKVAWPMPKLEKDEIPFYAEE